MIGNNKHILENMQITNVETSNIDPEMYYKNSKYRHYSVICNQKTRLISFHYKKCHTESEVFISRLSANYSERAKKLPIAKVLKSSIKAECYFCEKYLTSTKIGWIEHIRKAYRWIEFGMFKL